MAAVQAGMQLADAGKQYSQASTTALLKLNTLDKKFEGITERIKDVAAVHPDGGDNSENNTMRLIMAKNELAQIAGDLERMQCRELDAIETAELISGKNEARLHRKALNMEVENLIHRTQDLHKEFVAAVEKLQASAPARAAPEIEVEEDSPQHPASPVANTTVDEAVRSAHEATPVSIKVESRNTSPQPTSPIGVGSTPLGTAIDPAPVSSLPRPPQAVPEVGYTDRKQNRKTSQQRPKQRLPLRHAPRRVPPQQEYYQQFYPTYDHYGYADEPMYYGNVYRRPPLQTQQHRNLQRFGSFYPGFYF